MIKRIAAITLCFSLTFLGFVDAKKNIDQGDKNEDRKLSAHFFPVRDIFLVFGTVIGYNVAKDLLGLSKKQLHKEIEKMSQEHFDNLDGGY